MELESLMTSEAVGKVLGIHPKVVERMAKRGELPGLKVGRFWRYRARNFAQELYCEGPQQDRRKFADAKFALAFSPSWVMILAAIW